MAPYIEREVCLFPDASPLEGMFLHGWWKDTKDSDYKIYGDSLGLNSLVPLGNRLVDSQIMNVTKQGSWSPGVAQEACGQF